MARTRGLNHNDMLNWYLLRKNSPCFKVRKIIEAVANHAS